MISEIFPSTTFEAGAAYEGDTLPCDCRVLRLS
jgi:hypothetical protein